MAEDNRDYLASVESMADDIIRERGTDPSDWCDSVHENVDGSYYVIYHSGNDIALEMTNNEPDASDVAAMLSDDDHGDWRKVKQVAAFLAMEADVYDELRDKAQEFFSCNECNKTFHEDDKHDHDGNDVCESCLANLEEEDADEE